MPLYYFHVCNGDGFTRDEEGRELSDEAAARSAAWPEPETSSPRRCGPHRHLFTLLFSDAYTGNPRSPG